MSILWIGGEKKMRSIKAVDIVNLIDFSINCGDIEVENDLRLIIDFDNGERSKANISFDGLFTDFDNEEIECEDISLEEKDYIINNLNDINDELEHSGISGIFTYTSVGSSVYHFIQNHVNFQHPAIKFLETFKLVRGDKASIRLIDSWLSLFTIDEYDDNWECFSDTAFRLDFKNGGGLPSACISYENGKIDIEQVKETSDDKAYVVYFGEARRNQPSFFTLSSSDLYEYFTKYKKVFDDDGKYVPFFTELDIVIEFNQKNEFSEYGVEKRVYEVAEWIKMYQLLCRQAT